PWSLRGLGRPAAEAILERLQQGRNATIVYTACVVPDHGLPAAELVQLARQSVETSRRLADLENLGAAQYRAGRYGEALTPLREAVQAHGRGGTNWMKLFLAMACRQAGQPDQARGWFQRSALAKNADWQERLLYSRLRQEAAQVLRINP